MEELVRFEVKLEQDKQLGIFAFIFNNLTEDSVTNEKLNRIFCLSYHLPEPDYQACPVLFDSRAFFRKRSLVRFKCLIQELFQLIDYAKHNLDGYSNILIIRIELDTSCINSNKILYQDEHQVLLHKDIFDKNYEYKTKELVYCVYSV